MWIIRRAMTLKYYYSGRPYPYLSKDNEWTNNIFEAYTWESALDVGSAAKEIKSTNHKYDDVEIVQFETALIEEVLTT